jgi:hypothetical protein
MTANPSDGAGGFVVKPGMMVWNDVDTIDVAKGQTLGRGVYVGIVLTFVGTTLTLDLNPNIAPGTGDNRASAGGTAGDILIFASWTVM